MIAILSIGAASGSCAPTADCAQVIKDRVMLDYKQNGNEKARDYYSSYGLLFIVYESSVFFFPITERQQLEVGNAINAHQGEVDYLRLNVQGIDKRCDAEFDEFNTFATKWNDYMYSKLK